MKSVRGVEVLDVLIVLNCTKYTIFTILNFKTLSRVRNGKIGDTEIILIQN